MTRFFAIVVFLLGLLPLSVVAEEIVMICTALEDKSQIRILKYVDPLVGPKKVLQRLEGDWKDWGGRREDMVSQPKLVITDKGAKLEVIWKDTLKSDWEEKQLKKGDAILFHMFLTLDFEFFTRKHFYYLTALNGDYVCDKATKGCHPENKDEYKWNCKKHTPGE